MKRDDTKAIERLSNKKRKPDKILLDIQTEYNYNEWKQCCVKNLQSKSQKINEENQNKTDYAVPILCYFSLEDWIRSIEPLLPYFKCIRNSIIYHCFLPNEVIFLIQSYLSPTLLCFEKGSLAFLELSLDVKTNLCVSRSVNKILGEAWKGKESYAPNHLLIIGESAWYVSRNNGYKCHTDTQYSTEIPIPHFPVEYLGFGWNASSRKYLCLCHWSPYELGVFEVDPIFKKSTLLYHSIACLRPVYCLGFHFATQTFVSILNRDLDLIFLFSSRTETKMLHVVREKCPGVALNENSYLFGEHIFLPDVCSGNGVHRVFDYHDLSKMSVTPSSSPSSSDSSSSLMVGTETKDSNPKITYESFITKFQTSLVLGGRSGFVNIQFIDQNGAYSRNLSEIYSDKLYQLPGI